MNARASPRNINRYLAHPMRKSSLKKNIWSLVCKIDDHKLCLRNRFKNTISYPIV